MTWTGRSLLKAQPNFELFEGEKLCSYILSYFILETILGLKIWIEKPCSRNLLLPSGREASRVKNRDVAGSCWPKS